MLTFQQFQHRTWCCFRWNEIWYVAQLGFFSSNPTDASTISGFEFKIEGGDNAGKTIVINKGLTSGTTQLVEYNNSGNLGDKTNISGYNYTQTYFKFDWAVTGDDFVQAAN